jgi:ABC-2 type transport system permease protein
MKKILMIMANRLKTLFAYRTRVLFQVFSSILAIFIQYYLWLSIYSTYEGGLENAVIKGMTFNQTFAYVAIASSLLILMKTYIDWDMNKHIQSGDIILFLYKPIDYLNYMFASSAGIVVGNFLTVTIPSFFMIFFVFKVKVLLGWNILFFIITITGGFILSFLFDFLIGTTCFWTMSIWGISKGKDIIISFLSGALIPLSMYPYWMVKVLKFLPFSYMYNVPLNILISTKQQPLEWCILAIIQLFWILVVYLLTRIYFNFTIKYLSVNGG